VTGFPIPSSFFLARSLHSRLSRLEYWGVHTSF